jgi:hypothetical protein
VSGRSPGRTTFLRSPVISRPTELKRGAFVGAPSSVPSHSTSLRPFASSARVSLQSPHISAQRWNVSRRQCLGGSRPVGPKPCFIAAIRHLRGRARYAPLLAIIFACVTHYAPPCVATLMPAPAPSPLTSRAAQFSARLGVVLGYYRRLVQAAGRRGRNADEAVDLGWHLGLLSCPVHRCISVARSCP